MTKTVVTSFHEEGFKEYGKEFLESFRKHWPKSVKLVVYYEGTNLREDWKSINEVEGLGKWLESVAAFPLMSGRLGNEYNINFDARMVRKAFIQAHACKQFGGKVIWLDSDVITFDEVPIKLIDKVLPDDKMCCFLGRDGNKLIPYTESGWLGFNTSHPKFNLFMDTYLNVFNSGVIFAQPGWHDCYGFDAARQMVKSFNPKAPEWFNNLSEHLPNTCTHPFINSILGCCLDHRKGARKSSRSSPSELCVERKEDYWQWKDSKEPPFKKSATIMSLDTALQRD